VAGQLLVATSELNDPRFVRTVIYMVHHDTGGAMGLVVNRPIGDTSLTELLEGLGMEGNGAQGGIRLYYGGPVEPEMAIALGPGGGGDPTPLPGVTLVDLSTNPPGDPSRIRIYSGYAGWGAGQLEAEIAAGSWYLVQAAPDDPFDRPDGQWARVLRRQNGYLSLVSTFPDDVALN